MESADKMKKILLNIIIYSALLNLSNPANADDYKIGDVLYCEMESGAFANEPDYEFTKWKSFKFKFKIVNNNLIKFGSGGYFDGAEYKIGFLNSKLIYTDDDFGMFSLTKGRFNYANANVLGTAMLTGICDEF
jgi:hypothetical protein